MRVLLKEGSNETDATSILVLPQVVSKATFETLDGETAPRGVLAEAEERAVRVAINQGVEGRGDKFVSAKAVLKDIKWLHKALAEFELGSSFGLRDSGTALALDDSGAKRINRAEGLAVGGTIAVGPTVSPRAFMNARGRVLAIDGDSVEVELDAGDRDRIQRATGKQVRERTTLPLGCVETAS